MHWDKVVDSEDDTADNRSYCSASAGYKPALVPSDRSDPCNCVAGKDKAAGNTAHDGAEFQPVPRGHFAAFRGIAASKGSWMVRLFYCCCSYYKIINNLTRSFYAFSCEVIEEGCIRGNGFAGVAGLGYGNCIRFLSVINFQLCPASLPVQSVVAFPITLT